MSDNRIPTSPARRDQRLVGRALAKACRLAKQHREMNDVVAEMMIERYGIEPGNVDCDAFIECVDYGHGQITLKELDGHMTERGFPPNDSGLPTCATRSSTGETKS